MKVRPQRYDEIINAVGRVIGCQYDGLVLPIVIVGVAVRTMLAHLLHHQVCQTRFRFRQRRGRRFRGPVRILPRSRRFQRRR